MAVRQEIIDEVLRQNPWHRRNEAWLAMLSRQLPEVVVLRDVVAEGLSDRRKAHLVVGPRQAGKSTWVWSQLRGRVPTSVLYLNAESLLVRDATTSVSAFLEMLSLELPSVDTIFIDEAQHLAEAGLFIKGLVDARLSLDIWVTGSSSYHLAARTRESLAGRATRRRILPFSLHEVSKTPGSAAAGTPRAHVERQLVFGGYPSVWLAREPAYELMELLEAFVIRDASDRFNIERPDVFRRLIQLLGTQVGQMVNLAEWASLLGVSAGTVRNYLALLEESWLVKQLPPFAAGKRSEITGAARVFFFDNGLRNAALDAFSTDLPRRTDRGALYESLCFSEIEKTLPESWTLHYWRTKSGAEVDFVCVRGDTYIAIESKAGARAVLSRGAHSFIDAYAPKALILVSEAGETTSFGRTTVYRVGIEALAATLQACLAS